MHLILGAGCAGLSLACALLDAGVGERIVLVDRRTRHGWTTWVWQAREPMASYLTTASIGEFDLRAYRDDGIRYAAALQRAGVPVRLTEYVGMPHGFLAFPRLCRSAPQALAELCAEQGRALAVRD